jgi:hypothetical protein
MRLSAHWSTSYVTAAELERVEYLLSWWKQSTFTIMITRRTLRYGNEKRKKLKTMV